MNHSERSAVLGSEALGLLPIPVYKAGQAFLQFRMRLVAKNALRLVDVGPGERDVTCLCGLQFAVSGLAGSLLKGCDQIIEGDGSGIAEIEDFKIAGIVERSQPMQSRADTLDDVINVGVVSSARSIAEHGELSAAFDQGSEFVNREIRSLARAVNGEEAQTSYIDRKKVRVCAGKRFCRELAGRVRRYWLEKTAVLTKRARRGIPVDGTRRPKDEIFDAVTPGSFQQNASPADVHLLIEERLFDGRTDSGAGREMDYSRRSSFGKCPLDGRLVAYIAFYQPRLVAQQRALEIATLPCFRVEGIEVIKDREPAIAARQRFGYMRSNESCPARDKNAVHRLHYSGTTGTWEKLDA